nr:MAG TPA: hypothetical protein [Caudoviricetes sp.]
MALVYRFRKIVCYAAKIGVYGFATTYTFNVCPIVIARATCKGV